MKLLKRFELAIILPISILPLAGLLLGLGELMQHGLVNLFPMLETSLWNTIALVMKNSGEMILHHLSLVFAVGISIALTGNKGETGLYVTIAFLIMNVTMGLMMPNRLPSQLYTNLLGIETLQTSIIGGIVIGCLTAYIYKKIHSMNFLAHFRATYLILIINTLAAMILGMMFSFIWPPIASLIIDLSKMIALQGTHPFSLFVYGIAERVLTLFGLQQMFLYPLWYTDLGGLYTSIDGVLTVGDQQIWLQQWTDYQVYGYQAMLENIKGQEAILAGRFMSGRYPVIMFGLPITAYALYKEMKVEYKQKIGGGLLVAILACILMGVTEPLEFSILLVSPILYVIYALLAGLSFILMYLFNVHVGIGFSGGMIDLLIYGIIPGDEFTNWSRILIVGLFYVPVYYFIFRFVIRWFNLSFLEQNEINKTLTLTVDDSILYSTSSNSKVYFIIQALGGVHNIDTLDSCMSRLRILVHDIDQIDMEQIQSLGASGMFVSGNSIQAIFGKNAEQLRLEIEDKLVKMD